MANLMDPVKIREMAKHGLYRDADGAMHTTPSMTNVLEGLFDDLRENDEIFATFGRFAFMTDKSTVERIRFVSQVPELQRWLTVEKRHKLKSPRIAEEKRKSGNEHFTSKKLKQALLDYNESIMFALKGTRELSFAYANRSAVAFRMHDFDKCVRDVGLALENNYPRENWYKLLGRKAECYVHMGDYTKAIKCFSEAEKCIGESKLTGKERSDKIEEIQQALREVRRNNKRDTIEEFPEFPLPKVLGKVHPLYPCASDAFTVDQQKEKGRLVRVNRNIDIGDVLIVERPYACYMMNKAVNEMHSQQEDDLIKDEYRRHCHHCFQSLLYGIPCDNCSAVMFCNDKCKSKAYMEYHYAECEYLFFLDSLESADSRNSRLAFRMILKTNLQQVLVMDENLSAKNKLKPVPIDFQKKLSCDKKRFTDFIAVYKLLSHEDKQTSLYYFSLCILALMLVDVLTNVGYFASSKEYEYDKLVVAGHLVRHMMVAGCNQFKIHDYRVIFDRLMQRSKDFFLNLTSTGFYEERLTVGYGIYNTASLINHSCFPNTVALFYKTTLILRAIKKIKKGDEITICYGRTHLYEHKDNRQHRIESIYFFECKCRVCKEDWPMRDGKELLTLSKLVPKFKCSLCLTVLINNHTRMLYCPSCDDHQDMEEYLHMTMHVHEDFNAYDSTYEELEAKIKVLKRECEFMETYVELPSIHYVLRQTMLCIIYSRFAHDFSTENNCACCSSLDCLHVDC